MNESTHEQGLNLEKLGIRELRERLEVSPIIADPGSLGSGTDSVGADGGDGGGKHYECNIIKPDGPTPDDGTGGGSGGDI